MSERWRVYQYCIELKKADKDGRKKRSGSIYYSSVIESDQDYENLVRAIAREAEIPSENIEAVISINRL